MTGPGVLIASTHLSVAEAVRLAELAEALGYEEFWFTVTPWQLDGFMALALVAHRTRTIRVGPGVAEPLSRHPVVIAMSTATLAEIAGPRAQLGLGTGVFGQIQRSPADNRPVRALSEAIEIIRELLDGKAVDYKGEIFQTKGALGIVPSARIPIVIATHSPQGLRLSGRCADGVLLANYGTHAGLAASVEHIRTGERSAGRVGACAVNLRLEGCVSDDEAAALAAMRPRVAARLLATYPNWGYLDLLGIADTPVLRQAAESHNSRAVAACLSESDIHSTTLAGSPERVAEQLSGLLESSHVRRFTLRPFGHRGHPVDATMRAFVERSWPRVEGYLATTNE